MLLLADGENGFVVTNPGPWKRLTARVRTERLDRDLAAGADPDTSTELALRAQALLRPDIRGQLAQGVDRVIAQAGPNAERARVRAGIPVRRAAARAALTDLYELRRKLIGSGPVSAQGVAQTTVLLTSGWGPLYHGSGTDELRRVVRRAVRALDPVG